MFYIPHASPQSQEWMVEVKSMDKKNYSNKEYIVCHQTTYLETRSIPIENMHSIYTI